MARSATGWCHADIDARKLTNLGETEEIGHDRLAAAVLVGAVGMQSVAATAGLGIDQRDRQIVAAEKPGENAGGDRLPFGVAICAPGGQAGGDRRRGLHRLLIERARRLAQFAEAGGADGTEMTGRGRFAVSSANAGIASRHRRSRAFASPCPSASRPAAGAHCRTPGLPRTIPSPASRPTRGPTSIGRPENAGFPGRARSSRTTAQ